MKTGAAIALGVAAVGVSLVVVYSMRRPAAANPSPANANANANGYAGLLNSLTQLGTAAIKTFGSGSQKPTTPGQLAGAGDFWNSSGSYDV